MVPDLSLSSDKTHQRRPPQAGLSFPRGVSLTGGRPSGKRLLRPPAAVDLTLDKGRCLALNGSRRVTKNEREEERDRRLFRVGSGCAEARGEPVTARNAPAIVKAAGRSAEFAWEEFFQAELANAHTRKNYLHAVRKFLAWVEGRGLELPRITPGDVGEYLRASISAS